jgi:hypothetical protein
MTASQVTAIAALCLVGMGAYALYYNSDSAKETRASATAAHSQMGGEQYIDSITYAQHRDDERAADAKVRLIDSAQTKACAHETHVEAYAEVRDGADSTIYVQRLKAVALHHGGNALLVTQRRPTGAGGEAYRCG